MARSKSVPERGLAAVRADPFGRALLAGRDVRSAEDRLIAPRMLGVTSQRPAPQRRLARRDAELSRGHRLDREIERWREYDYVIVNDDLDEAFRNVSCIVNAERVRRDRRYGLFDFVNGLLTEEPNL